MNRHLIILLIAAIMACCGGTTVSAQKRTVMNRPYIDNRLFHYGLMLGMHLQDIEFQQNGYTDEEGNQWFAEGPNYEPGFTVGLLGAMRLSKHFELRLVPAIHFGTKGITFRNQRQYTGEDDYVLEGDGYKQTMSIRSTYLSIPIDIKFSGERFNNFRPYFMAGVNPMIDLTVKRQKQLLLKPFDLYLEVGFGCDFYSPWFKFIPEVKFCFGLLDIINKKRDDLFDEKDLIFTRSIDKGHNSMIVISFYFE